MICDGTFNSALKYIIFYMSKVQGFVFHTEPEVRLSTLYATKMENKPRG